jgi:hypothetical protein
MQIFWEFFFGVGICFTAGFFGWRRGQEGNLHYSVKSERRKKNPDFTNEAGIPSN